MCTFAVAATRVGLGEARKRFLAAGHFYPKPTGFEPQAALVVAGAPEKGAPRRRRQSGPKSGLVTAGKTAPKLGKEVMPDTPLTTRVLDDNASPPVVTAPADRSGALPKKRGARGSFDRVAYQRELMRKRRAAKVRLNPLD